MNPAPTPPSRSRHLPAILPGLLAGLAVAKFGNPVILDAQVIPPDGLGELLTDPWPNRWGQWMVLLLVAALLPVVLRTRPRPAAGVPRLLLASLGTWLGWQFVAATGSVDPGLTARVLPHFLATTACFGLGALALARAPDPRLVWIGLGLGLAVCPVRGANQHLVEFRQDLQTLTTGEATGWKDFSPGNLEALRRSGLVIRTNGVDVANPMILTKLRKGRVHGTLVYPNALAGLLLLLLPAALTLVHRESTVLRPPLRHLVLVLTAGLGLAVFYWSGSKAAWLVAIALAGLALGRQPFPTRWKVGAAGLVAVAGLAVFGWRFSGYLAGGAASAAARLDYWKAAAQVARENPGLGSGPGTFQRPYARLKAPDSEMARLVHNDYLEQFSDSGVVAGTAYLAFTASLLVTAWRRWGHPRTPLAFATTLGLTGWLAHGLAEFSLYIPGLAWPAFLLAGWLAGTRPENPSTPAPRPANNPATG